jgi:hypothetical protein
MCVHACACDIVTIIFIVIAIVFLLLLVVVVIIVIIIISRFRFTKIFSDFASQEEIYTECIHDLVKDFINGQNCMVFAYGTSSAGKTYTIQGRLLFFFDMKWICLYLNLYILTYGNCNYWNLFVGTSQESGIIPWAVSGLFNSIHVKQTITCKFKPELVDRIVELNKRDVQQEIAHR